MVLSLHLPFLNLPCPCSVVGNGNSGYNQHPRYSSRAICQNPQGECFISVSLYGNGKAVWGFGIN